MTTFDAADPIEESPLVADEAADAEFLVMMGKRVREARERRGMARRALAKTAGVSERYLAQLETGEGNSSIIMLRRVALALGIPLPELINDRNSTIEQRLIRRFLEQLPANRLEEVIFRLMRDYGQADASRNKRIALVGLRGAGKSTLGKAVAEKLRVPFVELDKEIEREAGTTLGEIFNLYGQSGYRRIELRCLEKVIQGNDQAVISVGGGVVSEQGTYDLLLQNCFTAWIKATPEEHMSRVIAQGDFRPFEGNEEAMEDLRRILQAREPLYRKADVVVDTSNQSPEDSVLKLLQAVTA